MTYQKIRTMYLTFCKVRPFFQRLFLNLIRNFLRNSFTKKTLRTKVVENLIEYNFELQFLSLRCIRKKI